STFRTSDSSSTSSARSSASSAARFASRCAGVPGEKSREAPRLSALRSLAGGVGYACALVDRTLLHLDVATRPIADVKAAIRAYWSTFSARPDEQVHALMAWERTLLERWVRPGDRVLLIGCGSGREIASLLDRCGELVGVEPAEETLA